MYIGNNHMESSSNAACTSVSGVLALEAETPILQISVCEEIFVTFDGWRTPLKQISKDHDQHQHKLEWDPDQQHANTSTTTGKIRISRCRCYWNGQWSDQNATCTKGTTHFLLLCKLHANCHICHSNRAFTFLFYSNQWWCLYLHLVLHPLQLAQCCFTDLFLSSANTSSLLFLVTIPSNLCWW